MNKYLIKQFGYKRKILNIQHGGGFVKIEHAESGIIVTKCNKYQEIALGEAKDEIKQLVGIWEK
jgi:hypothetical protein